MTSPLSRREQAILRRWGGWILAACLTQPEYGIPQAKGMAGGRSHFDVDGEVFWLNVTGKGLELVPTLGKPATEVLPWGRVSAHARTISGDLRARIRDNQRRAQEARRGYPTYGGRETEESRAEKDAQFRRVAESVRALDQEMGALLDEACPLAVDSEPADLLEMLEAMGAA